MRLNFYDYPEAVGGWLASIVNPNGDCIGFVKSDGQMIFDW